jgi:hypothetical protein
MIPSPHGSRRVATAGACTAVNEQCTSLPRGLCNLLPATDLNGAPRRLKIEHPPPTSALGPAQAQQQIMTVLRFRWGNPNSRANSGKLRNETPRHFFAGSAAVVTVSSLAPTCDSSALEPQLPHGIVVSKEGPGSTRGHHLGLPGLRGGAREGPDGSWRQATPLCRGLAAPNNEKEKGQQWVGHTEGGGNG